MGLDFGSKTCGVAISDPLGITAQSIETITRKKENKLRRTLSRIEELVKEYEVGRIVIGLPLHMNDEEGDRSAASREFADMVARRTGLEVIMWDERLTTVMAEDVLIEAGIKREHRKEYIDRIAASFILQDYMDYTRNKSENSTSEEK